MQVLEVLDFIEPTPELRIEYALETEGEEVAQAFAQLLDTPNGALVVSDLVARSGVMDSADDARQNGKRDIGLETLMIIKIGVDNERERQERRRG